VAELYETRSTNLIQNLWRSNHRQIEVEKKVSAADNIDEIFVSISN